MSKISVTQGRTLIVYSYSKDDIGVLNRIERPDGSGDLIFAASRQVSSYNSRNYSYYNASYGGTTGNMGTLGVAVNAGKLLGIANVRDVERIVRRTFK